MQEITNVREDIEALRDEIFTINGPFADIQAALNEELNKVSTELCTLKNLIKPLKSQK